MTEIPEIELLAVLALGWVFQQARAREDIPHWKTWTGIAIASVALWYWMTPDALQQFATNWRAAIVSVVMFVLSSQGASRGTADTKIAPGTNTK